MFHLLGSAPLSFHFSPSCLAPQADFAVLVSLNQQQLVWHSYTTSPSAPTSSLRPLTFSLYGHDAEAHAVLHFEQLAREVDLSFQLGRGVMEDVLKNVGLDRDEVVQWGRERRQEEMGMAR